MQKTKNCGNRQCLKETDSRADSDVSKTLW